MKKTLQDQYLLIKEGKGHKGVFLTEAKRQFPNIVRNAATFEEAVASLQTKNIISENVIGLTAVNSPFEPKKKQSFETAFESFLAEAKKKENEDEKVKAEEKKVSKKVEEDYSHNYNQKDTKDIDNLIFDQVMTGYYAEMKDPKNADKTMQELKDIVMKNLQKDPIHYTKDGQFGEKGLGYTTEAPGLGTPKEAKGKYKSSGYGDLNEGTMYGDSDGDFDEQENNKERAYWYYDAYQGEKDPKKKDEYLKIAREYGSYLGWGEEELPVNEEESKLREIIREMIDTELEEMRHLGKLNPIKSDKERGEGEPKHKNVYLNPKFIEKLLQNKDIKFITNNEGTRLLIKKNTTINPPVTTDSREKISTPPEIITFLNNGENQEPIIGGGKFPGLNNEMFEYVGLKNVFVGGTPGNRTVRITILNPDVKEIQKEDTIESLQESVEKELAAINKEAEHEIIASKLEKVQTLIDKKQAQISRLDEDEDLKDLTDAKKVKEISKDIKSLEKAKAKLEKMMHKGKAKTPRKEVIDETDETIDKVDAKPTEEYSTAKEDAELRYDEGEKIDSIMSNYTNLSDEDQERLFNDLKGKMDGMDY